MNPGLCIILYSKSAQLTLPSGEITLREGEKVDLDSWTWRRDRNLHSRDEASRKNPPSFDVWTGNAYIRSRRAKSQEPLPRKRRASRERADRGPLKSQRMELFSRPNLDASGARAQSAPQLMSNQGPSI